MASQNLSKIDFSGSQPRPTPTGWRKMDPSDFVQKSTFFDPKMTKKWPKNTPPKPVFNPTAASFTLQKTRFFRVKKSIFEKTQFWPRLGSKTRALLRGDFVKKPQKRSKKPQKTPLFWPLFSYGNVIKVVCEMLPLAGVLYRGCRRDSGPPFWPLFW